MARYVYRQRGGRVVAVRVASKPPYRGTPDYMGMGFHDKILNAYKMAEARGERPQVGGPSWSKAKRVHETAREFENAR